MSRLHSGSSQEFATAPENDGTQVSPTTQARIEVEKVLDLPEAAQVGQVIGSEAMGMLRQLMEISWLRGFSAANERTAKLVQGWSE